MNRQAYNIAEAAEILGLSESTVKAEIDAGRLWAKQVGRRWLVPQWSIDKFLGKPEPELTLEQLLVEGR